MGSPSASTGVMSGGVVVDALVGVVVDAVVGAGWVVEGGEVTVEEP
jgi:hypothetical protein